jgi:L-iduronidase
MNILIDCSTTTGLLKPFWASTGFTPATLLLTGDMRQQIIYLGSVPRQGIRYARIHYLLELIDAAFSDDETAVYDWSRLDQGLDLLVQNGLAPVFELMGNPNGQFSDFNEDRQLRRWRALVRDLAGHLIERYGAGEVEGWLFEAWNEPDIGFGWAHQWPEDEASFCNYYDACVEGLETANPRLVIGGPGTCRTISSLFRAFLAHCDSGRNYFTGRQGVRMDFISVHEKAARAHKEDLNPRTQALIEREAAILGYLREQHPRFAGLPFMNNECDPQVGWKDHHTWHARPYYAAWVCKSVVEHLERLMDGMGVDYRLLGNDHGFIGAWGNRTLLARFGKEDWIEDGQGGHADRRGWAAREFSTPSFAMIKKPVFTAMTLLSLLVDEQGSAGRLAWSSSGELEQPDGDAELQVLATLGADGAVAILVYYSRDRIVSQGSQALTLRLEHLPFDQAALAHYRIDEDHGDPYRLWEEAGAPDFPADALLQVLRDEQEPALGGQPHPVFITSGSLELSFEQPLHGVSLLLLQPRPENGPAPVGGLRAERFAGLDNRTEYLLRWDPLPSRAIRTYEVQRADAPDGNYERVNTPELLCAAYMVSARPGYYRVAARDFWDRLGEASQPIQVA